MYNYKEEEVVYNYEEEEVVYNYKEEDVVYNYEEEEQAEEEYKSNPIRIFGLRIYTREKNPAWDLSHVFPLMGVCTAARQNGHPDIFGFEESSQSRINYRKRFAFALGKR